ncbi:hypothetical protein ACLB1E_05765 [Escherichia coli]
MEFSIRVILDKFNFLAFEEHAVSTTPLLLPARSAGKVFQRFKLAKHQDHPDDPVPAIWVEQKGSGKSRYEQSRHMPDASVMKRCEEAIDNTLIRRLKVFL